MDGFFEILVLVIMIWLFSRGAKGKKKRQPRLPGDDAKPGDDQKEIDWDEAIGDVLDGLGLPRPETKKTPPVAEPGSRSAEPARSSGGLSAAEEWRRREELEQRRQEELEQRRQEELEQRRRKELEQRRAVARTSARRAEARSREVGDMATEGRSRSPRVSVRDRSMLEIAGLAEAAARQRREAAAGRSVEPIPPADEPHPPETRPEIRRGLTGLGLRRLEGLSELERAVVYAEILGPPKAFDE